MLSTRERAAAAAGAVSADLLIGGAWQAAENGRTLEVRDPANDEVVAQVADASPDDARLALDAAVAAGPRWAQTSTRERSRLLRATASTLRERALDLAALMTLEMGKPVSESFGEVNYAADFFDWYGEEAVRLPGQLTPAANGAGQVLTTSEPVGPCVLVTPWNFPLAMPSRKLAPALAAGCTAVIKPADLTPLCALALVEILVEHGLPDGVVNLVNATDPGGVIAPLLADQRTRKLSFTGSTPVGKLLMAQAAENVLRISLELGGNAPFVVCADADVDAAVEGAMLAKMRNVGEACTAANRFYVEAPVLDEFTERFTERMTAQAIGHGLDDDVAVGPLINAAGVEKAKGVIATAVADGATAVSGASAPDGLRGHFQPATVLTDVPADSDALALEVFAPVAPIVEVADSEEALVRANSTPFGLVAYFFSRDIERIRRMAGGLESGMVGINTGLVSNVAAPFGGVKWSGIGREGSAAGLQEYLETKYMALG